MTSREKSAAAKKIPLCRSRIVASVSLQYLGLVREYLAARQSHQINLIRWGMCGGFAIAEPSCKTTLFQIHGTDDKLIPYAHSDQL